MAGRPVSGYAFPPAIVLALTLAGCASYSEAFHPVEDSLAAHDPAHALELLEKQSVPDTDRFLYFSNKGMLLRILGKYEQSNAQFEKAKKLIDQFTAASITEQASSFVVNDTTHAYIGTPVEQLMLHTYAALNYLAMDKVDEARVEALQADLRLKTLMQDNPDSPLSRDPFSRYLNGLIYEELGEWSDAMIAYRKAYKSYRSHNGLYPIAVPAQLKKALILMADKVGLSDERKQYEASFGLSFEYLERENTNTGELIFLFHNGLAPVKLEHGMQVVDPESGQLIRVSLPYYERRGRSVYRARIRLIGAETYAANTELLEDIGSLEIKTLEAHMPAIIVRAIARAAAKYNVSERVGERNELAGLLVNIAGFISEHADTRSWLTLPAEIQGARLHMAPGEYTVVIDLLDDNNDIVSQRELHPVRIQGGRKQYLSLYWASPPATTRY